MLVKRPRAWYGMVQREREVFIDSLLVRIHFINVMIMWTGLAPWEFEFLVPDSLRCTFLDYREDKAGREGGWREEEGTGLESSMAREEQVIDRCEQ